MFSQKESDCERRRVSALFIPPPLLSSEEVSGCRIEIPPWTQSAALARMLMSQRGPVCVYATKACLLLKSRASFI